MSLTAGGGYEPPETATAELDEELTDPDDAESPLADEVVEVVEPDEVESDEVAVGALAVAPDEDEAATPGIVSALTVPKMPTPATAAKATYVVMLLSSDRALSRARIRASAALVLSMVISLSPASQSSL